MNETATNPHAGRPSRFELHQVDHLFLLIGGNPLPNYVAARLLTHATSHICLVASRGAKESSGRETAGTYPIAQRLKERLIEAGIAATHIEIIQIDDPSGRDAIHRALKEYPLAGRDVGLQYTGGTKPMSVHAYECLRDRCQSSQGQHEFYGSYLDPRQLAFRFGDGRPIPIQPDDCPLSLDELLALHGWKIEASDKAPVHEELSRQLFNALGDSQTLKGWREWCDRVLRTWDGKAAWLRQWQGFADLYPGSSLVRWAEEQTVHQEELQRLQQWVQSNKLKETKKELEGMPVHPLLSQLRSVTTLDELREQLGLSDSNTGYKALATYLDGGWLESYALACLLDFTERAKEYGIGDVRCNIKAKRPRQKYDFEFDVAAMRGYQLFAISCTTSVIRGENKLKLFEAYTRARQMGGDEARVALVGGYDDAGGLLDEILEEWQAPRGLIAVFGPSDWPRLTERLSEWFQRAAQP